MFKISYIYTDDKLNEIVENKELNAHIFSFYYEYLQDKKKAFRYNDCMTYWQWDKYELNKTLDLKRVNRCKDKFCSNCKQINVASSLFKVLPFFEEYNKKLKPILLTLTVPNCSGADLSNTITKMFTKFKVFYNYYSASLASKKAFKERKITFYGAIRALEVTYNKKANTYHPHLHIMIFADGNFCDFQKTMYCDKVSNADIEVRRLWTALYSGADRRKIYDFDIHQLYFCDIKPINDLGGILEVLKYTCKSSEITDYDVFKNLYNALLSRKAKQGYGILYSLQFEDEDIKEETAPLFENETAVPVTTTLQDLIKDYQNYSKMSRFRASDLVPLVRQILTD